MDKDRKEIGRAGEQLALAYLQKKGYQLVAQNYRHRRGEIDLIVKREDMLVFVEVKLRSGSHFGFPEQMVSENQWTLLMETAKSFQEEHEYIGPIRFDVVAILGEQIRHFEDAIF
jgi:putative endonuclease